MIINTALNTDVMCKLRREACNLIDIAVEEELQRRLKEQKSPSHRIQVGREINFYEVTSKPNGEI